MDELRGVVKGKESHMECTMGINVFKKSSRVHSKISLNFPIRLPIGHTSGANDLISRQAFVVSQESRAKSGLSNCSQRLRAY